MPIIFGANQILDIKIRNEKCISSLLRYFYGEEHNLLEIILNQGIERGIKVIFNPRKKYWWLF